MLITLMMQVVSMMQATPGWKAVIVLLRENFGDCEDIDEWLRYRPFLFILFLLVHHVAFSKIQLVLLLGLALCLQPCVGPMAAIVQNHALKLAVPSAVVAVGIIYASGWKLARGAAWVWLHYVWIYVQERRVSTVRQLARQGASVGAVTFASVSLISLSCRFDRDLSGEWFADAFLKNACAYRTLCATSCSAAPSKLNCCTSGSKTHSNGHSMPGSLELITTLGSSWNQIRVQLWDAR